MLEGKEIYELWSEYLKRSNEYGSICEYEKSEIRLDIARKTVGCRQNEEMYSEDLLYVCRDISFKNYVKHCFVQDERITGDEALKVSHKFFNWQTILNYAVFGDLFLEPFDQLWENSIKKYFMAADKAKNNRERRAVRVLEENYFDYIVSECLDVFNTAQNCSELVSKLKYELFSFRYGPLIEVDIFSSKTKAVESFKACFDRLKASAKAGNNPYRDDLVLDGNIYANELRRYLRLYDLKASKEKYANREIFSEIYPDLKKLDAHEMGIGRSRASKELAYAKQIIKNVENGFFPGPYAKTKGSCDPDLK